MRRGRDRDDACARIAGEQLAFVRIDLGEHDVGRRLERGECLLRCLRIVEEHGRDAVRCDDLRLRRDVPHQLVAERCKVVRGKRGPRDQQREAADQHVHPCEPPRDRPGMTASHDGHSPGTRLFETALATRSSSELIVSPASRADVRLISNRIRLPAVTNWIMPPRAANPWMSLTVRTSAWLSACTIALTRRSSDVLMKRMRQSIASLVVPIRLAWTFLPCRAPSATVESSTRPNGSVPRTQIVKGASSRAPRDGHSTKPPKLNRYAALISYSVRGASARRPQTMARTSAVVVAIRRDTPRLTDDRFRVATAARRTRFARCRRQGRRCG